FLGLQAFVSREELPPRIRADLSKLVRAFRVVVVLCRQNSPFLVVSGHPDVVALSKSERRSIPQDFSIGSVFEGEVYAVDKNNNVFFNIQEDDGKVSLVTAKLMAKNMDNPDKIAIYRPGSTHKLRVLRYSLFERSLFVTNKKELMKKDVEINEEFHAGQHVTLTVKVIADTGIRGTIGINTRATVIVHHTLDLPIASWQKAFKEGQKVKCRILYKHGDKHIYYLTAKPTLVNSNDEIITEYDKEYIVAIYRPGSTHKLRVLRYSLFERSLFVTNKKELMKKDVEINEEFHAGQHVTLTVKVIADTGIRGTIGINTRATVIVHHTLDLPIASWQKAFKEGQKVKCRILYKHADKHIYYLTAKPTLVNSNDEIITEYDKEYIGKFAAGLCAKLLDSGAIITFYNRVKAFLPLSEVKKITGLKEGVAVKGRILMVDPEKEKMTIVIGEKMATDPATGKKKKEKKSKAVKNLGIYTAKISGQWKFGGTNTTLLVELPDDNVGRLHVSEFGKYTSVKAFLKEYKNKPLNVRVIEVSKLTQLPKLMRKKLTSEKHVKRIYECTFDPKKLNDPKKKQGRLHYKIDFSVGDTVTAWLVESSESKFQKAEVNPVYKAQINPESSECAMNDYPDENGITRATGIISGKGELRKGKITGINRSKNSKVLSISVENDSK
uniref:S1 motif domain-containing protein n=1 Tax=Panagrolaimus sp. ES5 TaxID=591445 RepID=A0AC34G2X4_9BILA